MRRYSGRVIRKCGSWLRLRAVVLAGLAVASTSAGTVNESDICIYGATSGGVVAAVQAARMGKSVALVEPGRHVGGMTSGGLGLTDTGNVGTIGGISREFYRRVGRHYGRVESFTFEPHVAESVFLQMLSEANVPVFFQRRLAAVEQTDRRLTSLTMENGDQFRARMFIDTTYEGDLLAMAGVSFTVGREPVSLYGESLNGIRASTPSHQFAVPVDPYMIPGDPTSGLLPLIQPGDGGIPGDGDYRVQAYNFRLCLTQVGTNRLPIDPPPGYDPTRYELLGRYVAARVAAGHNLTLGSFLKIDPMPNGKTDINNNGAFSTDFIGQNYTYATNTYAERARIWREHEDYIQGFLTFLATDTRIPLAVRTNMQSWGLCRDEFQDTGGWPHQLYVREARRMVSDYIITQADCERTRVADDSIGLASYNMDSHNCQRIVKAGSAINEGDVQRAPAGPFPISYRAIVPRVGECENLLATFCLSGTHIAFSSCRMEPVFMITSQSAATAAAIAIDDNVPVQAVSYGKLRLHAIADHQILEWGGTGSTPTNGIILDSEQSTGITIVGSWTASTAQAGYIGSNYLHDQNAGKGTKSVRFTPTLGTAGTYTVYLRWTTNPNRASSVPITITYSGGSTNLTVNQQLNNGIWVPLASLPFTAGASGNLLISTTGTDGYVIADAALWEPAAAPAPPVIEVIASDPIAAEDGPNPAVFTFVRSRNLFDAVTIGYLLEGTAAAGVDYPVVSASLLIPAGQASATLTVLPWADSLPEGDETLNLTLLPSESYSLGAYTNAAATLRDGGFGAWRGQHFVGAELANQSISGERADPDNDSLSNLLEFFLGTDPRNFDAGPGLALLRKGETWELVWRRSVAAAGVFLRVEESADLSGWVAAPFEAQQPRLIPMGQFQGLRFDIPGSPAAQKFYRVALSLEPLPLITNTAHFFFSFDTQPDGNGAFAGGVTANYGFQGTPAVIASGSVLSDSGGAAAFTDFTGVVWQGSGGAGLPGRSLTFNPGSSGNQFSLTFSTLGLREVKVRMDVRSAAQAGGTAPAGFASLMYEIGGGPMPVPGASLALIADAVFHEWTADLSSVSALDNQPLITLTWTLEDLRANPAESLRVDNIQVTALGMQR